jgi:hypothetical protein
MEAERVLKLKYHGKYDSKNMFERFAMQSASMLVNCIIRSQQNDPCANSYFETFRAFEGHYNPAHLPHFRAQLERLYTAEVLEGVLNMEAFNSPPALCGVSSEYRPGCEFFRALLPYVFKEVDARKKTIEN